MLPDPQDPKHAAPELPTAHSGNLNQAMDALDILKRDRFELLSCYLDGEVTAAERKQVETWLETDAEIQRLHTRLLKLRHGFKTMPTPAAQPVEQTVEQVFARVDRRPKFGLALGVAGTAIAAAFVGALTGLLPGGNQLTPQMAEQKPASPNAQVEASSPESLMLALDRPPLDIPDPAADAAVPQDSGLYHDPSQEIR